MIVACVLTYALGKRLGFAEATADFNRQVAAPDLASLPCARVVHRLRQMDDVSVFHDASATSIGKARSRALFAALQANPSVIVFVDDDVEADAYTLSSLVEAAVEHDSVCVAPCITRGSNVVNVALQAGEPEWRTTSTGARTVSIVSGGFGLVAMSGEAAKRVVSENAACQWRDEDGALKPAVFHEELIGEHWLGEDVSFCKRALVAGVRLEALATGFTAHAGQPFRLEELTKLALYPERKPYAPPAVRDL